MSLLSLQTWIHWHFWEQLTDKRKISLDISAGFGLQNFRTWFRRNSSSFWWTATTPSGSFKAQQDMVHHLYFCDEFRVNGNESLLMALEHRLKAAASGCIRPGNTREDREALMSIVQDVCLRPCGQGLLPGHLWSRARSWDGGDERNKSPLYSGKLKKSLAFSSYKMEVDGDECCCFSAVFIDKHPGENNPGISPRDINQLGTRLNWYQQSHSEKSSPESVSSWRTGKRTACFFSDKDSLPNQSRSLWKETASNELRATEGALQTKTLSGQMQDELFGRAQGQAVLPEYSNCTQQELLPSHTSAWSNPILLEGEHINLNRNLSRSHQNKDALLELPVCLDCNETFLLSSGRLGRLESECQQSLCCNFLEVLSFPPHPHFRGHTATSAQMSEPEFRNVELKQ